MNAASRRTPLTRPLIGDVPLIEIVAVPVAITTLVRPPEARTVANVVGLRLCHRSSARRRFRPTSHAHQVHRHRIRIVSDAHGLDLAQMQLFTGEQEMKLHRQSIDG